MNWSIATWNVNSLKARMEHVLKWLAENPEDWRDPWVDWHSTRYEQKALRENRAPHYLTFRKH